MQMHQYTERRTAIETYFDRTAADAWARLTSTEPVSGIRETVRRGRDQMRNTLLSWLPEDLSGARILDAGCGTGALTLEAARRGADVVAIDIAGTLVDLARERTEKILSEEGASGRATFHVGDMLDPALGEFDYVVAMDSLIHYERPEMVGMVSKLAARARSQVLFTFAPRTPALTMMHAVGRLFPRQNRAPAIEPVDAGVLRRHLSTEPALSTWTLARSHRIDSGFYMSQALEIQR